MMKGLFNLKIKYDGATVAELKNATVKDIENEFKELKKKWA